LIESNYQQAYLNYIHDFPACKDCFDFVYNACCPCHSRGMANNLPIEKKVIVISMLCEGASIRGVERITDVNLFATDAPPNSRRSQS